MREIHERLENAKVDKIFQASSEEFYIRFFKTGFGKSTLRIALPSLTYLTSVRMPSPLHPKGFCMQLRKEIGAGRVISFEQRQLERIVECWFETRNGKRALILELFGKGNLILIDESYTILGAWTYKVWRDRTIKPKDTYAAPPMRPNPSGMDFETFSGLFQGSQKTVVKTLAVQCGLGGVYAEETCLRAGVDKDLTDISDEQVRSLYDAMGPLFSEQIEAYSVEKDDQVDVIPFPMKLFEDRQHTPYQSFNDALDALYAPTLQNVQQSKGSKKRRRLEKIKESQEQLLEQAHQGIKRNEMAAETIYSHYQEIAWLLEQVRLGQESRSWDEIREKVEQVPFVKKFDLSTKKLILDFDQ